MRFLAGQSSAILLPFFLPFFQTAPQDHTSDEKGGSETDSNQSIAFRLKPDLQFAGLVLRRLLRGW